MNEHARDSRDLLRGAAATLGGFVPRTLARLGFLFLAGNLFAAQGLGVLGQALAVVEISAALCVFGMKRAMFPFLAAAHDEGGDAAYRLDDILAHILTLCLGLALLMACLLGFVAWPLLDLAEDVRGAAWFAAIVPVIAMTDVLLAATRHKRRLSTQIWSRSIVEPWVLFGMTGLVYVLGIHDGALLVAYAGSLLAAFSVALYGFLDLYSLKGILRSRWRRPLFSRLLKQAGPTALSEVVELSFRRVDILILSLVAPVEVVGLYFAAQQYASNVQKAPQLFDPIAAPVLAQLMARKERGDLQARLGQLVRWVGSLQLLQFAFFLLFGWALLDATGPGLEAALPILWLLVLAETVHGSLWLAELPLIFEKPALNMRMMLIALAAEAGAIYALGGLFGGVGAAVGFLAVLALLNIARLIALARSLQLWLMTLSLLKPAIAILAAGGATYGLLQLSGLAQWQAMVLGVPLLIASYIGGLWLLGIDQADRQLWRELRSKSQ